MDDLFDFGNPFANDQPPSKKRQRDEDENQADIERSSQHDVSRTITYDNDEDFISSLLDDTPPKTQPFDDTTTSNQSQTATTKAPVLWQESQRKDLAPPTNNMFATYDDDDEKTSNTQHPLQHQHQYQQMDSRMLQPDPFATADSKMPPSLPAEPSLPPTTPSSMFGSTLTSTFNPSVMHQPDYMNQQQQQCYSDPKLVQRWTCDICRKATFSTFAEANAHETECKMLHDATKKSVKEEYNNLTVTQMSTTGGCPLVSTLTSLVLCPPKIQQQPVVAQPPSLPAVPVLRAQPILPGPRHPAINLVPQETAGGSSSILSDYNNLLVRNIEFYYPSSDNRVGLRCIHCARNTTAHVTAATFFPAKIGSISSGLGTIGARHFGWGKCPYVQPEVVQQLAATKKTSQLQTKSKGRVGLDAYCKNIAKQYGIIDDASSGSISWMMGTVPNFNLVDETFRSKMTSSSGKRRSTTPNTTTTVAAAAKTPIVESTTIIAPPNTHDMASVLANMRNDGNVNVDTRPFVPSDTQYFWECNSCRHVPFDFRAKGSVVYSVGEPSRDKIDGHLQCCTGRPLTIPHSAKLEPYYGQAVPTLKITWDSKKTRRTSGRTRRSTLGVNSIKTGVEDVQLCYQDDQQDTTDFAFFTITQLKKCYLTKANGSRGSCPLGFPGLACGHCGERRFFYTSADHLRNSLSHIPAHMAECSMVPNSVKARLEELKATRNSQKNALKTGSHKIFIDRVWERLHGPPLADDEESDDLYNTNTSSYSRHATRQATANKAKASSTSTSLSLIEETDKTSTSELTYFTLLQLEPYKTLGQGYEGEDDSCEIGFPGVVCKHCMKHPSGRKFFTTSSEHLGDLLLTISDHLSICRECPDDIKAQIATHQTTHSMQLGGLPVGEHSLCMQRVWSRLIAANRQVEKNQPSVSELLDMKQKAAATTRQPAITRIPIQYRNIDTNMSLVSSDKEHLVTPFTYYTMQQCRPCNLDSTNNGSRGTFDNGFPGIECSHCGDQGPKGRRFFYRSAEILSGNYSHIPNHILKCSACPPEVKAVLKQMKQAHQTLKHTLPKGSQKEFFNSVWKRLHGNAAIPTTATSTTAQVSFAAAPAPLVYGGNLPPPLPALPSLPTLPPMDYEQL